MTAENPIPPRRRRPPRARFNEAAADDRGKQRLDRQAVIDLARLQ